MSMTMQQIQALYTQFEAPAPGKVVLPSSQTLQNDVTPFVTFEGQEQFENEWPDQQYQVITQFTNDLGDYVVGTEENNMASIQDMSEPDLSEISTHPKVNQTPSPTDLNNLSLLSLEYLFV